MKLYRYMSITEFNRMLWGEDIFGPEYFAANTDSAGVCFLPEIASTSTVWKYTPEEAYEFLEGIVSDEVLVEFKATNTAQKMLQASSGVYCCPWDWESMLVEEFCMPYYNRDLCKPLRYRVPSTNLDNGQWFNCN